MRRRFFPRSPRVEGPVGGSGRVDDPLVGPAAGVRLCYAPSFPPSGAVTPSQVAVSLAFDPSLDPKMGRQRETCDGSVLPETQGFLRAVTV
jgi:hypothetical protein